MSRTIFITGANGFIGRAMRRQAGGGGLDVAAMSHTDGLPRQREQLARRQGEVALVHLAWPDLRAASSGAEVQAPDEDRWRRFVDWSMGLHAACGEAGVPFIGIGSGVEAYADPAAGLGEPYLSYARRKAQLREALSAPAASAISGSEISWVRLHFIFGPDEAPQRIVPSAIRAAIDGSEFVCGDRQRRRHWLHVDDLAASLCAFAGEPQPGVWDIAGRQAISYDELFALIERAVGRPLRLADVQKSTADGQIELIAPANLARNLPGNAGRPANLLERLTEYAQWLGAQAPEASGA